MKFAEPSVPLGIETGLTWTHLDYGWQAMNLYLIGYRGSGKTTVAAQVAKMLQRLHWDADDHIESLAKKSIREVFQQDGEAEFRRLESAIIRGLRPEQEAVVSLGGGAILEAKNRERLRATGRMVWLRASAECLWGRIESDPSSRDRRPSLTSLSGLAEVKELLRQREPIYAACADFTVDVEKMSPSEVAKAIVDWWMDDRFNVNNEPRPGHP